MVDTPDTTTTTTTTVTPWTDTLDPVVKGHIQTKGWDKLEPSAAAVEAIKSYMEAEKHIGVPIAQIARIPTDANDAAGWNALHSRLGVPEDKTNYKIGDLKFSTGEPLDPDFVALMSDTVHSAKLTPGQAAPVISAFMKYLDETDTKDTETSKVAVAQEEEKLKVNWGANVEVNNMVVDRTAARLGIVAEKLEALDRVLGKSVSREMLLGLGKAMGEARFITGQGPENTVSSFEQAVARKEELRNDSAFVARFNSGDAAAMKEMNDINYLIVKANHAR